MHVINPFSPEIGSVLSFLGGRPEVFVQYSFHYLKRKTAF